jgi:hypothetical protein
MPLPSLPPPRMVEAYQLPPLGLTYAGQKGAEFPELMPFLMDNCTSFGIVFSTKFQIYFPFPAVEAAVLSAGNTFLQGIMTDDKIYKKNNQKRFDGYHKKPEV